MDQDQDQDQEAMNQDQDQHQRSSWSGEPDLMKATLWSRVGLSVIMVETQRMPKLFVGNLATLVATSRLGPTLAKSQMTLEGTTFSAMVPRTTSGDARMR